MREGEAPSVAGSMCVVDICGEGRQHLPMSELSMAPSHLSLLSLAWGNRPVSEDASAQMLQKHPED